MKYLYGGFLFGFMLALISSFWPYGILPMSVFEGLLFALIFYVIGLVPITSVRRIVLFVVAGCGLVLAYLIGSQPSIPW
jgi:hypothetical protein